MLRPPQAEDTRRQQSEQQKEFFKFKNCFLLLNISKKIDKIRVKNITVNFVLEETLRPRAEVEICRILL